MIDKGVDRHAGQEPFQSADMVAVIMGGDQVIDLLDPQSMGGRDDARRTGIVAGNAALFRVAGVDQQRLAFGGDEQSAAAALDIDGDHLQGIVLCRCRDGGQRQKGKRRQWQELHDRTVQRGLPKFFCDTRGFMWPSLGSAHDPNHRKSPRPGRWFFRHPPPAADRRAAASAPSCSSTISVRWISRPAKASMCGLIPISGWPPSPICSKARRCTATRWARCRRSSRAT